jgi:hypothetical protein
VIFECIYNSARSTSSKYGKKLKKIENQKKDVPPNSVHIPSFTVLLPIVRNMRVNIARL